MTRDESIAVYSFTRGQLSETIITGIFTVWIS